MNCQKPTEIDVSLKYKCPNKNCYISHWLFLREAKTKNFKVVCDCGTTFKPKRIKNLKIVYHTSESTKNLVDKPKTVSKLSDCDPIIHRAISMMKTLGYSEKESVSSITAVYKPNNFSDPATLVKVAISNFGVNNE